MIMINMTKSAQLFKMKFVAWANVDSKPTS